MSNKLSTMPKIGIDGATRIYAVDINGPDDYSDPVHGYCQPGDIFNAGLPTPENGPLKKVMTSVPFEAEGSQWANPIAETLADAQNNSLLSKTALDQLIAQSPGSAAKPLTSSDDSITIEETAEHWDLKAVSAPADSDGKVKLSEGADAAYLPALLDPETLAVNEAGKVAVIGGGGSLTGTSTLLFKAKKTANQSIPIAQATPVCFEDVQIDPYNGAAANGLSWVADADRDVTIRGRFGFTAWATQMYAQIYVNDVRIAHDGNGHNTTRRMCSIAESVRLKKGDKVEIRCVQYHSSPLTMVHEGTHQGETLFEIVQCVAGGDSGTGGGTSPIVEGHVMALISTKKFDEAATEYTFEGLDGAVDQHYEVRATIHNTFGGVVDFMAHPNGDETSAHYACQWVDARGTGNVGTGEGGATGYFLACGRYGGGICSGVLQFDGRTGSRRLAHTRRLEQWAAGDVSITYLGSVWDDSTSEISSLKVKATQANAIGPGSVIEVWALRPLTSGGGTATPVATENLLLSVADANTSQTLNTMDSTALAFSADLHDPENGYNAGAYTVPRDLTARLHLVTRVLGTPSTVFCQILINGEVVVQGHTAPLMVADKTFVLKKGDVITYGIWSSNAVPLANYNCSNNFNYFQITDVSGTAVSGTGTAPVTDGDGFKLVKLVPGPRAITAADVGHTIPVDSEVLINTDLPLNKAVTVVNVTQNPLPLLYPGRSGLRSLTPASTLKPNYGAAIIIRWSDTHVLVKGDVE